MIRKTLKYTILLFTLFMVSVLTVNAATKHQFSFQTYVCTDWSDGDLDCNVDYTQVANGGSVNPGDVVRLDLMYVPGDNPDISFQLGFTFNNTVLSPIYDGDELLYVAPQPPYYDGIYPAAGTSNTNKKRTNWVISTNQYQNGIYSLYEDTTQNTTLDTAGLLTSYYFKVNTGATPGTEMNFNYDSTYTMFNNDSEFTVSNTKLEVFKVKDTDPSLKGITVKHSGTNYLTNFNSTTKTYNVYVPNSVSNVEIMGDPTKSTTVLTYSPTASGNVYGPLTVSSWKTVTISTVAEDGQHTDQYTVKVYRLSNANTLNSLSLSGISIGNFSSGTTTYTVTNPVPYATSSTTITASPASNKATVSPTSGSSANLNVGSNAIQIVVTPECAKSAYSSVPNNGSSVCQSKTYTVNVTRTAASTNNYLSGLTVNGTSVPNFQKTNEGPYNVTIGYGDSPAIITATPEDTDHAVVSGQIGSQAVNVGDTTLTITVTPEDPETNPRNYTVKIHRKSNNANLASLSVTSSPQGTMNPTSFTAGTTSYTYTVGPDVTEVTVNATPVSGATVSYSPTSANNKYNPNNTSKVEITVTPEDTDQSTKKYTVNLVRTESTDVSLNSLTVTNGTLSPSYSDSVDSYSMVVAPSVTSITVTPDPKDSRTTATVTGNTNLKTGDNTVTVTVTPEAGETAKRTITINVKRLSDDATLSALSLSGVSIGEFKPGTTTYTATAVPYSKSTTNITATATAGNSVVNSITGTGSNKAINVGDNTFNIVVSPENCKSTYSSVPNNTCTTKTYTVNVYRKNNNATLTGIEVKNGTTTYDLDPAFTDDSKNYIVNVPYSVQTVTVTPTKADTNATAVVANASSNLSVGDNNRNITVTPEDATATGKTYNLTVRRLNNDVTLSSLTVNGSSISGFAANKTSYEITVPYATDKVTITGAPHDPNGEVTGNVTNQAISVGENTITLTSKAEDRNITQPITIKVTRTAASTNADLEYLKVDGELIEGFGANNINYDISVPSTTSSVTITAKVADTKAKSVVITNSGNISLNLAQTSTATVVVTAESGATKTYTVNIYRKNNVNTLTGIEVKNGTTTYDLDPAFTDDSKNYIVRVPYDVENVTIIPAKTDSKSTATVANASSNLSVGNNNRNISVKAEDTDLTARVYNLTVRRLNNDVTLSSLTFNGSSISGFAANKTSYNVTIPYTTDKVTISATPHDSNGQVTGAVTNESVDAGGSRTFTLTVAAEDRSKTQDITITVNRVAASTTASLTDLTIDNVTVQGFDPTVFDYNVVMGSNVENITIGASVSENATISSTSDIGLKAITTGVNDFEVVAIAQDGSTIFPYELHVKRLNNNNNLTGLTISGDPNGVLSSEFSANTTEYTYTVGPNITEVTINATGATGTTVTYSPTSTNNKYDPNTTTSVTITVSPESCKSEYSSVPNNTCTPKTYTVNLVRTESSINTLSGITYNGTPISGFNPTTTSYTVDVPYDTPTMTVAATPSDGDRETVTVTPPATYGVGDNVYTIAVEAEDGTPNTYTVTVHRKNNNANLSSLTLDNVTFNEDFDEDTIEYTATVPYTTDTTAVHYTTADTSLDPDTNVVSTGDTNLSVGNSNVFTITVIPEDESEASKTYTVTVTREAASTEAYLTGITVNNVAIEGFDKDTTSYTVDVSNSTTEANIVGTANTNSTVQGNGNKTGLVVGDNGPYTITAVAQDGLPEHSKSYTVTIHRKDTNNNLSGLTITADPAGSLDTPFDPDTTEYTYTVGPDTPSITVTGTPDGNAQVTGDGTFDPTTTDKIEVVVTPEEGEPKTYTINVVRNKSTDVTLDELSVAEGTISPAYADDVDSYNVTVASTVENATVTATPHDSRTEAVVTGNTGLQTGDNTVTVTVTPESGDTDKRTITINVHKKNTDATLSSLSLDNVTLEPDFDPSITTYTATVPYSVSETAVNATASDTSRTPVIVGDTTLGVGENPFTITVTPEEGDPVTYTVTVTREDPSADTYLTGITVNGTAVEGFDKDTDTYTVDIVNSITEAEIIGTANTNSTVEGNGTQTNLAVGDNGPYTITAVAQNGTTTKPYYVTIHRKDDNNKLSGLVITADPTGSLDTPFDPDITEYTYTVGPDTPAITVTGTPAGGATVTGDGTFDPTTTDKIEVVVTPEDGTPQTYTINVVRNKSTNADLLSLGIAGYTISPSFDKDTILYTVTVPNSVDKVTVVAEKGDSRQSIDGLGQKDVVVGDNPLQVVVTPEDTTATPKTYTIKVTREANDNNYLSSLSVTGFNLKESFNKELQAYTLEVPTGTNSITVNATPEVTTSNVTITGADNLANDTNTVTVRVLSQKGTPRDYVIIVNKTDDAEFITSEAYGHTIADGMIKTVAYKTKPDELKDQLDNENSKLFMYLANGTDQHDTQDYLATGSIVKLIVNNVLKDSKIVVIKGDTDGDGRVTLFDAVKVIGYYLDNVDFDPTDPYIEAADVDNDKSITLFDVVGTLQIYLNDNE